MESIISASLGLVLLLNTFVLLPAFADSKVNTKIHVDTSYTATNETGDKETVDTKK